MRAELKSIFGTALPETYISVPEDVTDCWVDIMADIGAVGEQGADTFTFQVVTLKKLQSLLQTEKCLIEPRLIIVQEFDWAAIEAAICSLISKFEAPDWGSLAAKIHLYAAWEYDGLD